MTEEHAVTRRSVLVGSAAVVALGAVGALAPDAAADAAVDASAGAARRPVPARGGSLREPLWRTAARRGILYGSSTATWQISDPDYSALFARQAAILFTEDDLLWYRLKPTPTSPLDFSFADQIIGYAESNGQLVFGAHLVWDEGFGDGWTDDDLWNLDEASARRLLYGTMRRVLRRYRGRVPIWSCVNEAIVNGTDEGDHGLRTDVPWYQTIGPEYVAHAFRVAHETDPRACLVLNDFGYETVNQYGDRPEDKRRATLKVLDRLLAQDVPVHAFGIQAHLLAEDFANRFDARAYRRFLRELADRGVQILITELDVLDDGLPADVAPRDQAIADIYRRYLDVALAERAVSTVMTFGLSDRYTWLAEDYPRDDGADRRPLPFDADLDPKPAYVALHRALAHAPRRRPVRRHHR